MPCVKGNVVLVLDGNNAVQTKYTWGLDMSGLAGDGTAQGIHPGHAAFRIAEPLAAQEASSARSGESRVHGAGGIGGLLAAVETGGTYQGTYWFLCDGTLDSSQRPKASAASRPVPKERDVSRGNGNVGQVLNATDTQNIAVDARYEYDPFGRLIVTAGDYADANPFRFSTKWLDTELAGLDSTSAVGPDGLSYYGYRFYSPNLGRWMSRDPIEERGGLNAYGFVLNNAINSIDYLGTITCVHGESYDKCCETECDPDYELRKDGCKAIFDGCMDAAKRSHRVCMGYCNYECSYTISCSARAILCGSLLGTQQAMCHSANIGCLAGAEIAQIACYGTCLYGSQQEFPNLTQCPPGYF